MQSGTTSLWYYLSKHPHIFAHPDKEMKFFYLRHLSKEEKQKPGSGFPSREAARRECVSSGVRPSPIFVTRTTPRYFDRIGERLTRAEVNVSTVKVLLEATPGYFFSPLIPERVK